MSELTPTVAAQHGAFFLAEQEGTDEWELRLLASYGYKARKTVANRFKFGEALVGQAALERTPILITQAPSDYIKVSSGLGEAAPVNIIVLPVLFEDQVLGVIELASLRPFSEVNQSFLEQVIETIGVVLNTIIANMRTEELLDESQRLAGELQNQSQELQTQQEELRRSNAELESQAASLKASEELLQQQQEELQQTNEELQEKARLLADQNRSIEVKNREIEMARLGLEEKAQQLALSSKYKSEFLANMSHELRTPLNSLLILSKLLGDNEQGNLDDRQVEFAHTIHSAGSDLLTLINDILDLSKVEAGKMDVVPGEVRLAAVCETVRQGFEPLTTQKGLELHVAVEEGAPELLVTDEQRLQQVLKNLLSNAVKFTDEGSVSLSIGQAPEGMRFTTTPLTRAQRVVAFSVSDTGIGIPADKLRLVFEEFQQADGTTSRKYGGTGLGLSISRAIARLLGGEIRVVSEVDAGSTFTLYLPDVFHPVEPIEPDDDAPRAPMVPPVFTAPVSVPVDETALEPTFGDVPDDRTAIGEGDQVLLIVESDQGFARAALDLARGQSFKGVVATRGGAALALAREFHPDGILLDTQLAYTDGLALLAHLKQDTDLRHIPVHVFANPEDRRQVLRSGAIGCTEGTMTTETVEAAIAQLAEYSRRAQRHLLIVEDDETERSAVAELLSGDDVLVTGVGSADEALEALTAGPVDCMVLDLKLPKTSGFTLLERIKEDEALRDVPVIIYTGKDLTRREETRLAKYAETIIVKDARSPERLLEEATLFLHRPGDRLPDDQRLMLEQLHASAAVLEGKQVLIVDDDVRNVFALTSVLERHGMRVVFAENGRDGISTLEANPEVDIVLMDIMMPEMDGYETMAAIREKPQFRKLPIIALTAKAMKGDRERSIQAGASDYVTKPVNVDQLLSLMRVWLYD
jgi:signal transduction histidine kinase/CheY-like chemotaxis protein